MKVPTNDLLLERAPVASALLGSTVTDSPPTDATATTAAGRPASRETETVPQAIGLPVAASARRTGLPLPETDFRVEPELRVDGGMSVVEVPEDLGQLFRSHDTTFVSITG